MTTRPYLIENTDSGHLFGAYPGADELDAYAKLLDDAGDDCFPRDEIPAFIHHVYDPAELDRELTDDEREALALRMLDDNATAARAAGYTIAAEELS